MLVVTRESNHPLLIPSELLGFDQRSSRGIALLEAINDCGSINRAAAQLGMSYKSAWEQVELLNNLASEPLLARAVGGRGGGGTQLTETGALLVRQYRRMEQEYRRFLEFSRQDMGNAAALSQLIRRMQMKISARNVWSGQVKELAVGEVNAVVTVALRGGDQVVAVVTHESVDNLGLAEGAEVLALVKSSAVMLACEVTSQQVSARNLLCGTVSQVNEGVVNSEVILELSGGNTVHATVTNESASGLGLQPGHSACALIKASSVMLAVA
ncbi:MAG: ModE family transcriptional regulator [Desulfuromonas sp.]|nr:MAG: ModE family transcriptional regulator [Desulfuromonas sp.]